MRALPENRQRGVECQRHDILWYACSRVKAFTPCGPSTMDWRSGCASADGFNQWPQHQLGAAFAADPIRSPSQRPPAGAAHRGRARGEEAPVLGVARPREDLFRGPLLDDLALEHHHHPVGEVARSKRPRVGGRGAGKLGRLAEPLVQQLHEMRFQLTTDAFGRVDELKKRFDVGVPRVVPTNRRQPAQLAGDPVSLLQQVVELLVASSDRRRIVAYLRENRPPGAFEMILERGPGRGSCIRPRLRR
jgi:hypothetical protein